MPVQLRIIAIIFALAFMAYLLYLIRKNRANTGQVRKWILLSVLILIGTIFYKEGVSLARLIGFTNYSYFALFSLVIVLLLFLFRMQLSVIKQDRKISALVQELSILKKEISNKDE